MRVIALSPRRESSSCGLGSSRSSVGSMTSNVPLLTRTSSNPSRSRLISPGEGSTVQFSEPICYVEEDEGEIEIWVQRLGPLHGYASVSYSTENGSAKAARKYHHTEGILEFEDGVADKSFRVPIIDDDEWSPTVEFKVNLEDPQGCNLSHHLRSCRVKIIDDDLFPSNKYREVVEGEAAVENVNPIGLFFEYTKFVLNTEGLAWRSLLTCVMDQLHNLYLLFTLWAQAYLVDVVFAPETDLDGRSKGAAFVGIGYMAPMIILFAWDRVKINLSVGGRVRTFLQASLFRKYLNYSESSRLAMPPHIMQHFVIEETVLLAEGYTVILEMIRLLGKLVVLMGFVFQSHGGTRLGWTFVVVLPTLNVCFCYCRSQLLLDADKKLDDAFAAASGIVSEVCTKYGLIVDFKQRPQMNDHFYECLGTLQSANVATELINSVNEAFPRWIGGFSAGFYITFVAKNVGGAEASVSLGGFLATLRVLREIANDFEELYLQMIKITKTIGPLRSLTFAFNLPTDARDWREVNRRTELATREWREARLATGSHESADPYLMKIVVSDLNFCYVDQDPLFENVSIEVGQGQLVAVMGHQGSGKATFMRLLGQSKLLSCESHHGTGNFFWPSHLRVLHVSREPVLLNLSAWKNLAFGLPETGNPHDDFQRVLSVLTAFKMEKMHKLILEQEAEDNGSHHSHQSREEDEDGDDDSTLRESWMDHLTYTEHVKLHFARAFVSNPDVMVLQRPLHHFDSRDTEDILQCICSYARHTMQGFALANGHAPKPRSVFYSADDDSHVEVADVVLVIKNRQIISKERSDHLRRVTSDVQM